MRVILVVAVLFAGAFVAKLPARAEDPAGMVSLFDGTTLNGWKHSGNWIVEDGTIARTGKGGSLVYSQQPVSDDFELRFEWKVGEGSNSGVYYRPGQYEYQILDNAKHRDGKNPRTSAASLYFCLAPSEDATKPAGDWNAGRIVCKGSVIQHWLNGKPVLSFDYTDSKWAADVERLRKRGADLTSRGAYLSLQDHGDPVWYRNLRCREIPADEAVHADPNFQPMEPNADVLKQEREKLERILKSREKAAAKN